MSLGGDRQGHIWAGLEDTGVWRFDPRAPTGHQWTQFTTKDGLGDDNGYALTCDTLGRVWVGHLNHGVSVFNGKTWKNYDQTTGPLGSRVFALTTSPVDGDVWGSTDVGLFRYSLHKNTWRYYTRADGLPSDQASSLAFDKQGVLYVGTQADGLAVGTARDDYHSWRLVAGRGRMPRTPGGDGLPAPIVTALLVASDGTVYCGTTHGLARSNDHGVNWRFLRGADWEGRAAGLYRGGGARATDTQGHLLLEDYVTCLAEDGARHLLIGHRKAGMEAVELGSGDRVYPGPKDTAPLSDYVTAFLPVHGRPLLAAQYGGGLRQVLSSAIAAVPGASSPPLVSAATVPPLPAPAVPPTTANLRALLRQVRALTGTLPIGGAAYLGEDWNTEGDSTGRYGRQYTRLLAAQSPWGDHFPTSEAGYIARPQIGPHTRDGDSLRFWVQWAHTDNPRSLYDPEIGYRRQSEADDHGEGYERVFDGPNIWFKIAVPAGMHRVTVYDMNKDGHDGDNRDRHYTLGIKAYADNMDEADAAPALARAALRDFWGGVYKSFVVRGPSRYWLRVGKNGSLNTICAAVFMDDLPGGDRTDMNTVWMGGVRYDPPVYSAARLPTGLAAANSLWAALDAAWDKPRSYALQQPYRLLCYRAALAAKAAPDLLANWRWSLHLWTAGDRKQFDNTMAQAYQSLLTLSPRLKTTQR